LPEQKIDYYSSLLRSMHDRAGGKLIGADGAAVGAAKAGPG